MSKQGANAFVVGGYEGYEGVVGEEGDEEAWGSLRERSTLMAVGVYGSNFVNHSYRPIRKVRKISPSPSTLYQRIQLVRKDRQSLFYCSFRKC